MASSCVVRVKTSVVKLQVQDVEKIVEEAVSAGTSMDEVMQAVREGLEELQEKYSDRVIGTPELFTGALVVEKALKTLRKSPMFKLEKLEGKVVIGTVASPHEAGKMLVRIALEAAGFDVFDIGENRRPEDFIKYAQEFNADILASSCMVTYALPLQKKIEEELVQKGLKGRIRTLIGGTATSPQWGKEIGADGYGKDLIDAVRVAKTLVS